MPAVLLPAHVMAVECPHVPVSDWVQGRDPPAASALRSSALAVERQQARVAEQNLQPVWLCYGDPEP